MKNKVLIIILVFSLFFIHGCWDVNEIEKTQFPTYITVDTIKNNKDNFLFSMQFPILRPNSPQKTNSLSTIAPSVKSAVANWQNRTMGWISLGMLRSTIFSSKIAKRGLLPHIDLLWRDPIIPGSTTMAIAVNRQAAAIKELKVAPIDDLGVYLDELFDTSSKNSLYPQKTLNSFFIALKSTGIQPTIPLIKYGTQDINIVGLAIFKEDKMVGKVEAPEARALLLLQERFIKGAIDLKVDDYIISYYIQQDDSEININYQNNKFIFDIDLNLDVDVTENTSSQKLINNPKFLKKIEKHLATSIKKEINKLLAQLQKHESDIIGIGKKAKVKYPNKFNQKYWGQQFSQAQVDIDVQVSIRRIGISI